MFFAYRVISCGKVIVPDNSKEVKLLVPFLSNFCSINYSMKEIYLSDGSSGKHSIQTDSQHPFWSDT